MRLKRIIAVLFAVALVFSTAAVFAESDTTIEFSAGDAVAMSGQTVKVPIKVVSSTETEAIGCCVLFDPDVLTYSGYENTFGFETNDIMTPYLDTDISGVELSVISVQPEYNGTVITLVFKCNADISDGTDSITTEITPVYSKNACIDYDLNKIPEENQTFNAGTIEIRKAHTASSFDLAIEGEAKVGSKLQADITNFSDSWNLEPKFKYQWKVDGKVVGSGETYTPSSSVAGKTVKLEVTSTVDAKDNPSTTVSVTSDEVEAGETQQSSGSSYSDDDYEYTPSAVKSYEVKITSQPPETVEYKEGEDIKLSVKAENAKRYKWEWYELTAGDPLSGFKVTEIVGANSAQYVIEKADASFDGKMIKCTAMSDDTEAKTDLITLKMTGKSSEAKTEDNKDAVKYGKASDWAEAELKKANEAALIPSVFEGADMTKNITRQEFAHVAVKLYEKLSGKKAEPVSNNPFTDTNDTEVLKAFNVGITLGTSETTFTPDSLITREQMATMLTRALSKAGIDTAVDLSKSEKFSDDSLMNDWGRDAIYFMSGREIILGMGDGSFGTLGSATREQALLISVRSAEVFAK